MDRRLAVSLVFVALASLAAVDMVQGTRNYVEFFVAMRDITVKLVSVSIEPAADNSSLRFRAALQLENPSGHRGMVIKGYGGSLSTTNTTSGELKPYSAVGVSGTLRVFDPGAVAEAGTDIVIYNQMFITRVVELLASRELEINLAVSVGLSTFLDALTATKGMTLIFHCKTSGEPVVCTNVAPMAQASSFGLPQPGSF